MKKSILLLVALALVLMCSPLAAEQWIGDSQKLDVETPHPYASAEKGERVWTHTIHKVGASWLKLHFSDFKLNDEDYLELVDMEGNVQIKISGNDLDEGQNKFRAKRSADNKRVSFWGPAIDGDEITINLYRGSDKRKGYGFKVDEVGIGAAPIFDDDTMSIESICSGDNKESIACAASTYQTRGRSVGRMTYQKNGSWYVCTGFLVSCNSSHFLTNEHCITNQATCDTLQVRFNYRLSTCGGSNASYTTFYGNNFVTDNTTLDFCLVTLTGSPQNTWGYLKLINGNPIANEDIYIIQHPAGRRQEIGYGTVYSTSTRSGYDFSYYVDTEGGSSGSPVFAEYEDEVIGLHHLGGCPNSAVKMNHIYEYITNYLGCN